MKLSPWLLAFVFACGTPTAKSILPPPKPPEPVTFPSVSRTLYIDPDFSHLAREAILESLRDWTDATRGIVSWRVKDFPPPKEVLEGKSKKCTESIVLTFTTSSSSFGKKLQEGREKKDEVALAYTLHTCEAIATVLFIDRLGSPEIFRKTVTHEIGHQLGLDHNEFGTVMSPYAHQISTCITKEDLKDFCGKYKCDPQVLKGCQKKDILQSIMEQYDDLMEDIFPF